MTKRISRPTILLAAAALSAALVAVAVPWALSGGGSRANHVDPGARGIELVGRSSAAVVDPAAAGPVSRAEQAFAVALVRRLAGNGNVSVSPASLAVALAMLQNGAAGTTRDQIRTALQTSGLSDLAQNAGWQALVDGWAGAARDGSFTLSSANAAWLQKDFPVRPAFLDALRSYYRAGVWQVDYAKQMSAALAAINNWTEDQTNGKITKLFDQLDPLTVLVLADAVYFKAAWAAPFDAHLTHPGRFTLPSGNTVTTPLMNSNQGQFAAAVTSGYEAVQLPYRGGRFAALVVMPRTATLPDFEAGLTAAKLAAITSSLRAQAVDLTMPRFTTRSTLDLKSALSSLGMSDAFTDRADFSAMTTKPVQVAKIIQRVYLSVGEKGTEAAAATGVDMIVGSARVPVTEVALDHPFLFLVRDTVTGAILFASQVVDPTAG